ncbi:hypothetical protein FDP41_012246 [Naegleria fowleri]|uniref:U1-type domain-containing protein n=1 Tax=Naegleria fowleri TaxID=5763 RepID=A0A6A5C8I0_NAEFO|nr:uncharacterized protein FDP41_012246 [Naegleria fowleri]KAF0981589.1 hypothetical protein FDP41_012246 [Naegleria fowleri]CAG4712832.1 unnamed protein product [Naegleria fowleri]
MSTPSWKPKGNTFCKYCQQWIRDTPSEQKRHERSKHHVINVQNYIRNQQQQERNIEKEQQRNRKLLDNIEKRVSKNINNDESSNPYYQQYLQHQAEMQKVPIFPPPIHLLSPPPQQQPPLQDQAELIKEQTSHEENVEPELFEHNDLPLSALVSASESGTEQQSIVKSKKKKKTAGANSAPAEIGGYYDDPNYFYYEQEESKEDTSTKATEDKSSSEQKESFKDVSAVPKTQVSSWKNKYAQNYSTSASATFGQWEVVSVTKREPVASNDETSHSFATDTGDHLKNDDPETHEEDKLGGSYTHHNADKKKRKFDTTVTSSGLVSSTKKVKSEDSTQPKKPISFSLSKKK